MKGLVAKVLAWRAVSIVSMLLTMWVLTGDLMESTALTLFVQAVQTMVHYGFEWVWESQTRGRLPRPGE